MTVTETTVLPVVIAGIDAHKDTYHVAILSDTGKMLADNQFQTTSSGYRQLQHWVNDFDGTPVYAIESAGSYAAGLTGFCVAQGV